MSGKSQPYHPSVCVPLVLAGPGIRKNVVCDKPAETLDLAATFLDYAGIAIPKDMDSKSLRSFLEGSGDLLRTYATSSLGNWSLVFDGRYKLVAIGPEDVKAKKATATMQLELYDLETDPAEVRNVAGENPDIVVRLKPLLLPVAPYH